MTPTPAPPSPEPAGWDDLVQRARRDAPAPVDLAALLRTVRAAVAASPATPAFLDEFAALFATRRALFACAAAALACATLATWQTWSAWQELGPWADLTSAAWELSL